MTVDPPVAPALAPRQETLLSALRAAQVDRPIDRDAQGEGRSAGGGKREPDVVHALRLDDGRLQQLVQAMAAFPLPGSFQSAWRPGDTSQGKVLMTVNH